jgi:death-on-curing protein
MSEPVWINKAALMLAHRQSLAEYVGLEGIRDEGLLESALARPKNLYSYEGIKDVSRLAVSYAVGILRNHPFADGNKRAAFIALNIFLGCNGLRLKVDAFEAGNIFLRLLQGRLAKRI